MPNSVRKFSLADFLRLRQIILANVEVYGGKLGVAALKETEDLLGSLVPIPKGITPESRRVPIPLEVRLLVMQMDVSCEVIKEMRDIMPIRGPSPKEGGANRNDMRKKRRRNKGEAPQRNRKAS